MASLPPSIRRRGPVVGQAESHPTLGLAASHPTVRPLGTATSHAGAIGSATSAAGGGAYPGGVIDPTWRPPPPKPEAPPVQPPTYTPPTAPPPIQGGPGTQPPPRDPRLDELLRQLSEGGGAVDPLDLSSLNSRGAALSKLLAQLMRGEGITIGDQSNDPAARAYAVQKRREAERAMEAEASAAGANAGLAGGGLEGRAAQLREHTGEAIAANLADITNKRKAEALQTAITGANLQMSDLDRETRGLVAQHQSRVDAERLGREGQQTLLQALLSQDAMAQSNYQRDIDRRRDDSRSELDFQRDFAERRFQEQRESEMERLRQELLRQEVERNKRELELQQRNGGGSIRPGGGGFYAPSAPRYRM